jgi:hypothetical protein
VVLDGVIDPPLTPPALSPVRRTQGLRRSPVANAAIEDDAHSRVSGEPPHQFHVKVSSSRRDDEEKRRHSDGRFSGELARTPDRGRRN